MKKIIVGAANHVKSVVGLAKEDVEKLAAERLKHCATCPSRVGVMCGECGCILEWKTRVGKEQCPLKKW